MPQEKVICLDTGSTGLAGAVFDPETGSISKPVGLALNPSAEGREIIDSIVAGIKHLWPQGQNALRVAMTFPAPMRFSKGVFEGVDPLYYGSLAGVNLRDQVTTAFKHIFNIDVRFYNKAQAFLCAEVVEGRAKEYSQVIGIHLGRTIDGAFFSRPLFLREADELRGVPAEGCVRDMSYADAFLHEFVSETFLEQSYASQSGQSVKIKEMSALARNQESAASMTFGDYATHIGKGLFEVVQKFKPEAVVFGGKISRAFDVIEPILSEIWDELPSKPKLLVTRDPVLAPLIGAGLLYIGEKSRNVP